MACYIITFEVADDAPRVALRAALESYGGYCPIHANAWAIMTQSTANQIRDKLKLLIGQEDCLFVVRSGTEAAWSSSYGPKHREWLKKNL